MPPSDHRPCRTLHLSWICLPRQTYTPQGGLLPVSGTVPLTWIRPVCQTHLLGQIHAPGRHPPPLGPTPPTRVGFLSDLCPHRVSPCRRPRPHLDAPGSAHPRLLHERVGHRRREEGRLAGHHGRPQPGVSDARARHRGRHCRRFRASVHGRAARGAGPKGLMRRKSELRRRGCAEASQESRSPAPLRGLCAGASYLDAG